MSGWLSFQLSNRLLVLDKGELERREPGHFAAEGSLLSAIDWAKRQSATLFELMAATDLAELLLKQDRMSEGYKHLNAAISRMPAAILSPDHTRAMQILSQLQSGNEALS